MKSAIRLSLLLVALPLVGCTQLMEALEDDPPRINTPWAAEARNVQSPDTPSSDDPLTPTAEYGPQGEREIDDLAELSEEEDLGRVVINLGEGVFELEDQTILRDALEVVLTGRGPNRTRLTLETEELRSLVIDSAKRVVIRDLTVVGYLGGGVFLESCPDVQVENVHFAGLNYGLGLRASTATVSTSVFAGCQRGIALRGGQLMVRETAFKDCWKGLEGKGIVYVESSAFVDNRSAMPASLNRRSSVISCLFVGEKQDLGWKGRPKNVRSNLAERRNIGKDFEEDKDNLPIQTPEQFPEGVAVPRGFDTPGVHLALARWRARGESDPESEVTNIAYDGAERYAIAAQKAFKEKDLPSAQAAARIALRYWGNRPMEDAPEALIQVGELGR